MRTALALLSLTVALAACGGDPEPASETPGSNGSIENPAPAPTSQPVPGGAPPPDGADPDSGGAPSVVGSGG